MNYQRVYDQFIADRRQKESDVVASGVYTEKHHILPCSLGGDNSKQNLICLSFEDHVRAHVLLARIHGGALWAPVALMAGSQWRGRTRVKVTRPMRRAAAVAKAKHAEYCVEYMRDLYDGNTELRGKLAAASKENWKDPEYRARVSEAIKRSYEDNPERKASVSEYFKQRWADPDFRDNLLAVRQEAMARPEVKEKIGTATKELWEDPEYRARMYVSRCAAQGTPEARSRNAENARTMHQRPGFKEKHREATKNSLTPEVCAARGAALSKALMASPEFRVAKSAAASLGNQYRSAASKHFGVPYRKVTSELVLKWKAETGVAA